MWKSSKRCGNAPCPNVAESPDNCPDGTTAYGIGECRGTGPNAPPGTPPLPGGGGGGGAGGGGGTGGGSSNPTNPAGSLPGVEGPVWNAILARLNGGTRFTPEVMAQLLGSIKSQGEATARGQAEESNADLASRGLARSGIAARQNQSIRAGVGSQVLQARAGLEKAKIDADYQDKSEAINEGLNYLGQLRQQVTSMYATDAQRQAAMAQIALAERQMQQQLLIFREQYAQQLQSAQLGL